MSFSTSRKSISRQEECKQSTLKLSNALNYIKLEQTKAKFLELVTIRFNTASDIFLSYLSIEQLLILFQYDKEKLKQLMPINISFEECISSKNLQLLKYYLFLGIKLGEHEMNLAIEKGALEILKWLNSIGIALISSNTNLYNSINLACKHGHIEIVKYMQKYMFVTEMSLQIAIENGHFFLVEYLLIQKINIKVQIMDLACNKGHLDIAKYLFYMGYIPSDEIYYKAIINKNIKLLELLINFYTPKDFCAYVYKIGNTDIIKKLNINEWD